jgi:hypothetical protein
MAQTHGGSRESSSGNLTACESSSGNLTGLQTVASRMAQSGASDKVAKADPELANQPLTFLKPAAIQRTTASSE